MHTRKVARRCPSPLRVYVIHVCTDPCVCQDGNYVTTTHGGKPVDYLDMYDSQPRLATRTLALVCECVCVCV